MTRKPVLKGEMTMQTSTQLKHTLAALALLALAGCVSPTLVGEPDAPKGFKPVGDRISDQAIASDLAYIQSLRLRLKAINEKGRAIDDYFVCKADEWLNMAYDEYTDNDRGPIIEAAAAEAAKLIVEMEAGGANLNTDTALVDGASRVREDLWKYAADLKAGGFIKNTPCAACELARMEVDTVWIGHEYQSLGWRHAEPEILAAERHKRNIVEQGGQCAGPAKPLAPTLLAPPAACMAIAPLALPNTVHFAYDRYELSKPTKAVLDQIANSMLARPEIAASLLGRADEHQKRGLAYQVELSRKRAEAVRNYLAAAGVSPDRVSLTALGVTPSEPGLADRDARSRARRVEVIYTCSAITPKPQTTDLQP